MMREPFENVRLRSLLFWMAATIAISLALWVFLDDHLEALPLGLAELGFSLLFFGSLFFWSMGEIKVAQVPLRALFRPNMGGLGPSRVAALVAAGILFSLSSTWLFHLALIFLAGEGTAKILAQSPIIDPQWAWPVMVGNVLVVVFIAPVLEEIIFRGLLLRSWAFRYSLQKAILVPALVFAFLHPFFVPAAFALGVLYALLYLRTQSLVLPITLHGLNKASVIILGDFWFGEQEPGTVFAGTLLILIWSSIHLGRFMYYQWPRPEQDNAEEAVEAST